MDPEIVVTLIHGTFAKNAAWIQRGSALYDALAKTFKERILIKSFCWSGANSVFDRVEASDSLIEHIESVRMIHPRARQALIAHSHGGNVALYALAKMPDGHPICGVACLSTPFIHASVRDLAPFSNRNIHSAITGLCLLCIYVVSVSCGVNWTWGWLLLIFVITPVIGIILSSIVEGILITFRGFAESMADTLRAVVSADLDLLIVRIVGDEAQLGLASAQFLSWVTSRAYVLLAASHARDKMGFQLRRTRLPKWIWLTWLLFAVSVVFAMVVGSFWVVYFPESLTIAAPKLAFVSKGSFFLALIATIVSKTTGFDNMLFGAAMVCLMVTNALAAAWLGTVPKARKFGNLLIRWLIGVVSALLVEVHTEATPVGSWTIEQLEQNQVPVEEGSGALVHSTYSDPRVHALLITWLTTWLEHSPARVSTNVRR